MCALGLDFKHRTEHLSPNPIGQVPARLGPNPKETKATAATAIQHTAIHKFKLTSCAQGWTCKTSKWQTVSNKTQKMHKQTKQQNPTFKSTLSNERIFLSICFECPTFCWISWRFLFFLCVFFRVKFMFVYSNCQWFACLFLVPGLGLAGIAIYLFAKVW